MRAEAHLFEPWLNVEGAGFPVKPLRPTVNELRQSFSRFRGAFGSLRRKLSGGPGAYEGLWGAASAGVSRLRPVNASAGDDGADRKP